MTRISQATPGELNAFKDALTQKMGRAGSFEEIAQGYTSELYKRFRESIVLGRVFVPIPYENLPAPNKVFVDKLAASKRVSQLIQPRTLVLSLLGTTGVNAVWNDRRQSQGHVGIPMVSAAFIDAIPMMSRLLKQLGVGLDWIDSNDSQIVTKALGSMSGIFYVADAATETDNQGRKIIAAQDFVTAYKVKTVLGFGSCHLGTNTFVVTILFLQEAIEKSRAELFAATCSLKATAVGVTRGQSLFRNEN